MIPEQNSGPNAFLVDLHPGDEVKTPFGRGHVSSVGPAIAWVHLGRELIAQPFPTRSVTLVTPAVTEPDDLAALIDEGAPRRFLAHKVATTVVFLLAVAVVTAQATRAVGWPGCIASLLFSVAVVLGGRAVTAKDAGDVETACQHWQDCSATMAAALFAACVGWVA